MFVSIPSINGGGGGVNRRLLNMKLHGKLTIGDRMKMFLVESYENSEGYCKVDGFVV